jgi:protein TonB
MKARVSWRRYLALLAAVLLHVGILWFFASYVIDQTEAPGSDPVDVAIVPPAPSPPRRIPPPKLVPSTETAASGGRPHLLPAPRLSRVVVPGVHLELPPPMAPNPPMSFPAAAGTPVAGTAGNGSSGNGAGAGAGSGDASREGTDYLIRLKAYIDAHKSGDRHREPHDADVILVLDPDGRLTDIHMSASSGDPAVDDDIIAQLRRMSPFPKPPAVLFGDSKTLLPLMDEWIFPRP